MADVSEGAVALAKAELQQGQPPKDRVFYARHHTAIKWTPYRPNSQEVKRGKMGRWQELRPFGIGWQNTEVVPEAGAWVEDIINRPEPATRAAPPAMDREAVDLVAGPIWAEQEDDCFTAEIQTVGGHEVVATVHGGTRDEAERRQLAILSTLSADAIRQGEGCLKAREEGYRAGYLHVLGLARAGVPTKDFERDVGAYMADFVGGRP